jgi:hypothetical protein
MKEVIISLLILVGGNKIESENITIYQDCYSWYQQNVAMTEKRTPLFSTRSFHYYKGKRVVGFICNFKEPFSEH